MTSERPADTASRPEASRPFSTLLDIARRYAFPATQWLAIPIALWLALKGYRLIDGIGEQERIDEAAKYFGAGLLLVLYFAWDGRIPALKAWPRRASAYVRAHPLELGALALVSGIGAFVRLWKYGVLPPDGYLILEEHINSGVSWDILHGARPYIYPIPRYLGALSLKFFGPSTDGVRAHSVITGVLCVPAFYLMMREATSRMAALFATAMFASLRVLGDTMVHYQSPMLFQILMVWMALRGLRTGNVIWFVPAAIFGALLSYEYETSKALPLFFGAFLVWIALRRFAWPLPRSPREELERLRAHAPAAIKAAVIIGAVFFIVLTPMVAQTNRGQNIYTASLDRQKGDREGRGTPGTFAPDWEHQLRESLQVFTPWVKPSYIELSSIERRGAIDKVTSLLIWAGVISGVVFFWRGYRALFIGWFVGGMLFSSLLLSVWAPWKVIGWLVPAVALTAFLAEDAETLLRQYRPGWLRALPVALAGIVALALVLNLRVLSANANDDRVIGEYANSPSQQYVICDKLRDRPDDNYSYVSQRARTSWGWSVPLTGLTELQEAVQWGDFRFVCMGLRGESVSTLSELWPVHTDRHTPLSLAQVGDPKEMDRIADELTQVMPDLGAPDIRQVAPRNVFAYAQWNVTADELNAREGLVWQWLDAGGNVVAESVVHGQRFEPGDPPPGAATFHLRGLAYLPAGGEWALVPVGEGVRTVTSDGAVGYSAIGVAPVTRTTVQMRGWHLIEAEGDARAGLSFSLQWRENGAGIANVTEEDTFALAATEQLWRHERHMVLPNNGGELEAVRYDLAPHYAAFDGLRVGPDERLPIGTRVTEDRWHTVWTVPEAGAYRLFIQAFRQKFDIRIDGSDPLKPSDRHEGEQFADILLSAGEHEVTITLTPQADDVSAMGALFEVQNANTGAPVTFPSRAN